jgi:hypothetical protein
MISQCTLTTEQLAQCRRYFGNPEMSEAQALRRFEIGMDYNNVASGLTIVRLSGLALAPGYAHHTTQLALDALIERLT